MAGSLPKLTRSCMCLARFPFLYPLKQRAMATHKELDLENAAAADVAGVVEEVQISSPMGSRVEGDHILDFNVANFSTPAGKQILHDVGKCLSLYIGQVGILI